MRSSLAVRSAKCPMRCLCAPWRRLSKGGGAQEGTRGGAKDRALPRSVAGADFTGAVVERAARTIAEERRRADGQQQQQQLYGSMWSMATDGARRDTLAAAAAAPWPLLAVIFKRRTRGDLERREGEWWRTAGPRHWDGHKEEGHEARALGLHREHPCRPWTRSQPFVLPPSPRPHVPMSSLFTREAN